MKAQEPKLVFCCDVLHCKKPWVIAVHIRKDSKTVTHGAKLCVAHYHAFQAGHTPTLKGR